MLLHQPEHRSLNLAKQSAKSATKFKIPPIRIDTSDCEVFVGREIDDGEIIKEGTGYKVHDKEWIEAIPVASLASWLGLSGIQPDETEGDAAIRLAEMDKGFNELCESLSKRLTAGNWTDMVGEPLPQPYRNPAALKALSVDEILYLTNAINREGTDDRKNESSG